MALAGLSDIGDGNGWKPDSLDVFVSPTIIVIGVFITFLIIIRENIGLTWS